MAPQDRPLDGTTGPGAVTLDPADTANLRESFYHEAEISAGGVVGGTVVIAPDPVR